jgi:hypothetical protein
MSKNFFIILFAGLFLVALFTRSCGKETPQNTRVEDSLTNVIKVKQDSIANVQLAFDNLSEAFQVLSKQKQKIKYEPKYFWKDKYITDSTINAYTDTTTVRKFIERFYSN